MEAGNIKRVFSNRNVLVTSFTNSLASFFRMLYTPFWSLYLRNELGLSIPLIGLLSAIQRSEQLLFQLPGGIFADRLGRKKLSLMGAVTRIIPPLIYLMARGFNHLLLATIFVAMGSISQPAFTAMIAESLPRDQMGSGYALFGMARRIPSLFTGILGGVLMDALGIWTGTRVCLIGSFIGAITVFVLRYFFLTETLVRELGRKPSIKEDVKEVLPLFKGYLRAMQVASAISQFAGGLTGSLIIIYVREVIKLTNTQWGFISTVMSIISFITAIPGGMMADKFNRRKLITFARSISPITTIGYIFLRDFWSILAIRMAAGIGVGLSGAGAMGWLGGSAWNSLMADIIPPEKRGRVTGLMGTISGLSALPAPYIGAYMWETESIGPENTMWTQITLGLIATFIFWNYVRDPRTEEN